MSSSILRLSVSLALAISLAGCGGSSTSSTGPTGPTGTPTTITYTFSADGVPPTLFATKIGSGAFTATAVSGSKATISIPSGQTSYSVAYLCSSNVETINQATIADGTSFTGYCQGTPTSPTGVATAEVDASAIAGADTVSVGTDSMAWSSSILDFSQTLVQGTYDIPVTVTQAVPDSPDRTTLAAKILRAQTIPGALNAGAPIVFQTTDELVPQTITYNSVPSGFKVISPYVTFTPSNGDYLVLNEGGPTAQYLALPSSALQTGDYYFIDVAAINGPQSVHVVRATSSSGPQSFTFPAPWSYSGPTAAARPTFNLDYAGFSGMSGINLEGGLSWFTTSPSSTLYEVSVNSSANYQNGSASVSIPDLSAVSGFIAPPASGASVQWNASISQNAPITSPPSGTSSSVSAVGSYTVP